MDATESPAPQADEFYVLKQGSILGPFTRAELQSRVDEGHVAPTDFGQTGGLPIWQPLSRILESKGAALHGAVAPDWRSLVSWVWLRLRHDLDEQSVIAGSICLGLGLLSLALSRWPFVFWLPWIVAALIAGLALCQRRRMAAGGTMLLAALALPILFFVLGEKSHDTPQAADVPEPTPAPALAKPPAPPRPELKLEYELPPQKLAAPPVPEMALATEPAPAPAATPAPAPTVPVAPKPAPTPEPVPLPSPSAAPATADTAPPQSLMQTVGKFFGFGGTAQRETKTESKPDEKTPDAPGGGEFMQQHRSALVVVRDRGSAGSGFIANAGGHPWMFTNIHVAAGMPQPQFTRLDGQRITPGTGEAAVGFDAIRFALPQPPAQALDILNDVDANAKIGDKIVVLGNSGGGGVVTSLPGELVGIGPDRIEVTAEFIPGNSGSPIIHVPSGKIIGIATYLTRRYEAFASAAAKPGATPDKNGGAVVVRRFGYRLDTIQQWQPVNWRAFQAEAREIEQIATLTGDVFDFIGALRSKKQPQFATSTLRRPAEIWVAAIRREHLSEVDREQATRGFLGSLRSLVQADVVSADSHFRYAYFREQLREEREVRDRLYKSFDEEAKAMSTPAMSRGH